MLAFFTQDAEQIDQIFRQSALTRDKWLRDDYRQSTIDKALKGLSTVWQPRQPGESQRYGVTQAESARRFKDSEEATGFRVLRQTRQPQIYRYCAGVWRMDNHGHELKKAVREISKVILAEMVEEADAGRRDKLFAAAKALESKRGLNDVADMAVMELGEFLPGKANAEDDLICVANGIVSLSSGRLLHHNEVWQFTLQSPINYEPEAQCPLWLKFVDEFCCGDAELGRFIQVWLGYCCSGFTNEHKMAVFFGFGQNGKSVLLEVIKHILGGFAATTGADTLLQRRTEQSNDIAALEYKRFAVAIESDEGQAMAEGRVKSLTGGDEVVCRKLFEEFQTFKPRFKLNLATNVKPRVAGTDNGIWRRLLLIPCNAEVTSPDKHLFDKLKKESSGILNWLVEGFQIWQREGLIIPQCVRAATDSYRRESDSIGRFLDDVCSPWTQLSTQSSLVYKAYSAWCAEQGQHPYSQNKFSQKMAEKGYPTERKREGSFFPGSLLLRYCEKSVAESV